MTAEVVSDVVQCDTGLEDLCDVFGGVSCGCEEDMAIPGRFILPETEVVKGEQDELVELLVTRDSAGVSPPQPELYSLPGQR